MRKDKNTKRDAIIGAIIVLIMIITVVLDKKPKICAYGAELCYDSQTWHSN